MKSIMMSIRPEWVAKIFRGEKEYEVRTTAPKEWKDYLAGKTNKIPDPMIVYIYCTQKKKPVIRLLEDTLGSSTNRVGNGKVVGRFILWYCKDWHNYSWQEITKKGCLSDKELQDYSKGKKNIYIWEINNLEIFYKPKELYEFSGKRPNGLTFVLEKAPQSFMYVES